MKNIIVFLLLIFSVFFYFAFRFRQSAFACSVTYQEALESTESQSQAVFYDHKQSCRSSYQVISDWDSCIVEAEHTIPVQLQSIIRPVVSNYMLFFQEKKKNIDAFKRDHDERCKDYGELLFFPPDAE